MRIAIWHNLPSGGGMRALVDQISGLLAHGHEVEVWTPTGDEGGLVSFGSDIVVHRRQFDFSAPNSVIGNFGDTKRFSASLHRHCAAVATEIDNGCFQVAFSAPCRSVRTPPLARYLKTPSVLYLQEPYRYLYESIPDNPWIPNANARFPFPAWWRDVSRVRAMRWMVREEVAAAKAFTKILVNSRFSRESVLRAYGVASSVCYLGIDATRFVVSDRRENHVIGIGAFVPEKNIELAIDAIALLPGPKPKLVWIGNVSMGAYLEALKRRASDKGVIFEPKVGIPEAELARLLATAKCMVYAPRLEPFGYAPLEAGASGVPVVGIAEGGVRETIEDGVNGYLVDGGAQELSAALARILDDPDLGKRLGDQGREIVANRWSFETAIDRLEKHLIEVAAR